MIITIYKAKPLTHVSTLQKMPPSIRPVVKWRDISKDLGVRMGDGFSNSTIKGKENSLLPKDGFDEDSEVDDVNLVGGAPPPARHDAWLDGPCTVIEGVEKRRFLGQDIVDLESPIVRNLLSRTAIGALPLEEDDSEALSILPVAPTANSKDPFLFLPSLR